MPSSVQRFITIAGTTRRLGIVHVPILYGVNNSVIMFFSWYLFTFDFSLEDETIAGSRPKILSGNKQKSKKKSALCGYFHNYLKNYSQTVP
jgi:hypothetical protein